ncbi:hypothetical protein CO731_01519 [Aminobacter sp. MSH1]|nr:hypothetical protein CO731_01519 [Aminobacter sp. MSH1]
MIPKTPLPLVSYSGPDPTYSLDEDDGYTQLEAAYGQPIPGAARAALSQIADNYLADRRAELARQTWRDVAGNLTPLNQAAVALWELAYGAPPASGDASYVFDSIVDQLLDRDAIPIRPQRGDLVILRPEHEPAEWERFDDYYQPPEVAFGFRLTREVLQNLAMALRVAANRASSEIEKRAAEAVTSNSWTAQQRLLLRVTDWARDFGLPFGAYDTVTELPTKFSDFLRLLLQLAPDDYREKELTSGAVAARLRRTRQEAKTRKREQVNQQTEM